MSDDLKPWEIHPALTQERVEAVGTLLWNVRRDVALRMDKDKGDTLWGVGCSSYERSCYALERAAAGEYHEWLSTKVEEHHFVIKIGGFIPCRFYRGRPNEPTPARYATPSEAEKEALQYAFDLIDTPTPGWVFRFEVETDSSGYPVRVSLLQADPQGGRHNVYPITVREAQEKVKRLSRKRRAVKLPKPKVESLRKDKQSDDTKKQAGDSSA